MLSMNNINNNSSDPYKRRISANKKVKLKLNKKKFKAGEAAKVFWQKTNVNIEDRMLVPAALNQFSYYKMWNIATL